MKEVIIVGNPSPGGGSTGGSGGYGGNSNGGSSGGGGGAIVAFSGPMTICNYIKTVKTNKGYTGQVDNFGFRLAITHRGGSQFYVDVVFPQACLEVKVPKGTTQAVEMAAGSLKMQLAFTAASQAVKLEVEAGMVPDVILLRSAFNYQMGLALNLPDGGGSFSGDVCRNCPVTTATYGNVF